MNKEINLRDLVQVVIDADTWTEAIEGVEERLGKTARNIVWRHALETANHDDEETLDVLEEFALSQGWIVEGVIARNKQNELEDLREENLRLKGNLEHYAKQLRDVPPPGTKERLAEALEKLQTETLRSSWLQKELDVARLEKRAAQIAQELSVAQSMASAAKAAVYEVLSRGGKGGLESLGLGADQNLEE